MISSAAGESGLAGGVGRAGVLAAVAHDAGIRILDQLPLQVFQLGRAILGDAFIFKVDGRQLPDGLALGPQKKVERGHEQMHVLGIEKVGHEQQNAAQRAPEKHVLHHGDDGRAQVEPQHADHTGKRLPQVHALLGQVKAGAQEARAHVQQDEGAHDGRRRAGCRRGPGVDGGVLVQPQGGGAHHKAPRQQQCSYPQGGHAEHIGDQPVDPADRPLPMKTKLGKKAWSTSPRLTSR